MNTKKYAKIGDKLYEINTSYKVALKCDEVAKDEDISDYEKTLAIIYLLYGDEGLKNIKNYDKLLELALKYLSCGEEVKGDNKDIDMDFKQDFRLIKASFMSDFGIDLSKQDISWEDFYTYVNGLTEGCILNRVRMLRTYDASKIEDNKERQELKDLQKRFALKKLETKLTKEQEQSMEEFNKIIGI